MGKSLRLALFACLLTLISFISAYGAELEGVYIRPGEQGQVKIHFEGAGFVPGTVSSFEITGEKPRVVIDFKDTSSPMLSNGNFIQHANGPLVAILGAVLNSSDVRVVLDLKPGSLFLDKKLRPNLTVITIKQAINAASAQVTLASSSNKVELNSNIPIPRLKPPIARKPVIVIDAGHGGRDPGALGGLGLREKKVTLAAAKELKRQLVATGRYKVVLTRGEDLYIEHEDRLRMARAHSADLFISLHADATAGKSARGASVYTLADRARNRSKKIVNSQNWIMDVNLSEQTDKVGDILVDLAQRDTFSQSTTFADILIQELGKSTKLLRNTHRRAGYYVLLAPDVPAVLLELGFISNPADEKLLKSENHRRKLMTSVVSAINRYFSR